MTLVAYDFETEEIKDYPQYPPKPVGISIYEKGGTPYYYAWGHSTGNNCTETEAIQAISKYWHSAEYELIAWNSPFDRLICHVHWGLPLNSAAKQHDGLVLAFLLDPHARELGLKPVAEKELGLPPEERDAVKDWLVSNGVCKDSKRAWGAHISKAPGDLVGKYANGDTLRTLQLFELQYKKVVDSGMLRAYEREMALQPIMLAASIEGIPVSAENLKRDIDMYSRALEQVDARIFELCGVGSFNINSAAQLADAIDRVVPGIVWPLTKTGRRSTSKATMEHVLGSLQGELLALLQYRASVNTCVNTFMKEWLRQATHPEGDGKIHCLWHTTRSDDGGARTGRLSSNPSFMNIPTLKSAKFAKCIELWEEHLEKLDFPGLPNVRYYIDTCNDEELVVKRDFCLAPDTEFLTNNGFKLFDDITEQDLVAYWDKGQIGYEAPIRRIDQQHTGHLVSLQGAKSFDILATPDHDMLFSRTKEKLTEARKIKLEDLPVGSSYGVVPTAGYGVPGAKLSEATEALIAAYQADCKLKYPSSRRVVFKASKQRKIERLQWALSELGIEYKTKFYRYAYDSSPFTWIIFALPEWVDEYVDGQKCFTRSVLRLSADFLAEVTFWDGTAAGEYFSIHRSNVDLIQELAVLRGRHTTMRWVPKPESYGTGFWSVTIHGRGYKYTKTQSKTLVAYSGRVVCFEMPHGTLVCRRGGGTFVTGNCSQELRVLAHYEDGPLLQAFKADPGLDLHQWACDKIKELTGIVITRKQAKTVAFSILYGSGLAKLAEGLHTDQDAARTIKDAYLDAIPGIAQLSTQLKARAKQGRPIRTWGSRQYYVEPPRFDPEVGRWRSFEYKMLNYLIQGSSADISKDAIIEYAARKQHGTFLLMVHDELVLKVHKDHLASEMQILKECMESVPLDCPLTSEGEIGRNYHELELYND